MGDTKHCWEHSFGFSTEESSGIGVCLLPDGHEGEHEFTDANEIELEFTDLEAVTTT